MASFRNPPDGKRHRYFQFAERQLTPVVRETFYSATLTESDLSERNPIPLYGHDRRANNYRRLVGGSSVNSGSFREVATDRIRILWSPRPLVWDRTEAGGELAVGSTPPALPVARGGIPPYIYELHARRPDGITIGQTSVDASGATINTPQSEPFIPTGAVRNDREDGYYPCWLICRDSGLGVDGQWIQQRWNWTVPPPA